MKKTVSILLILPIIFSCVLYSPPPLGETNFPLKQVANVPIEAEIKEIALGNTWLAVRTYDSVIALDIDTLKVLWTLNIQVSPFGEGFQMVDDMLVAASREQIFLIARNGQKRAIELKPRKVDTNSIFKIEAVYPDYLYVFRGDDWTLEAYDIKNDKYLWSIYRERPGIIYDTTTSITYVIKFDVISAVDNQSGKILWEQRRQKKRILPTNFVLGVLDATLNEDILYIYERTKGRDYYRITAIDVNTQKELWMKDFVLSVSRRITNITVVGDVLLANGGNGLIAIDKLDGTQIWETNETGEGLFTQPVKIDDVIYIMGDSSNTVFAISAGDGSVLGTVNLGSDGSSGTSYGGVFNLKDGILFNTSNLIVIYKVK